MDSDQALPIIGVIQSDARSDLRLAHAAARQPGWSVRIVDVDEPASDTLAGLVVDVPIEQRAAVLERLVSRYRIPILTESPVAADVQLARLLETQAIGDLVAANPLRYALHTRRLLEALMQADDALQSFFAAWRFGADETRDHALPQLIDYLGALCPARLERLSGMQRDQPAVTLVTLRYASDVLGSIEVNGLLPVSFPSSSELVVECFGESSAYVCLPGNQAVSLYGRGQAAYDWQPDPADEIVGAFAGWLAGGPRPPGGIRDDVATLGLVERIAKAAETDAVLDAGGA